MDYREVLDNAIKGNGLTLIIFYADWSPHYEWMDRAIAQEAPDIEVVRINTEANNDIAQSYNIDIVPSFVLFKGERVLWKQTGEVTPGEFQEVISMFNS